MRSRNIEIIVYKFEELEKYTTICIDNKFEFAYILHDKDTKDDGELKKAHYHFRIFGENQKTISAWAKTFQVEEYQIETLDNKKRAIRYLVHFDSPSKYAYNIEDIVTNIQDINTYFDDSKQDEYLQLKEICRYIDNIKGYCYFFDVKNFVLNNNYWSSYRRYYSIIRDLIQEKNKYAIDYMLN